MRYFIKLTAYTGLILSSCHVAATNDSDYDSTLHDIDRYYSQYMMLSNDAFSDIITKDEIQFYLDSVLSLTVRALPKYGDRRELLNYHIEALSLAGRSDEADEYINRLSNCQAYDSKAEPVNVGTGNETSKIDKYVLDLQSLMVRYDLNPDDKCLLDTALNVADRAIDDAGPDYRIIIAKLYAIDRLNLYDDAIEELSKPYAQCINDSLTPITNDIFKLRFKSLKALSVNDSVACNNYLKDIIHLNELFLKDNQQSISDYLVQPFSNDSACAKYMMALTSYYYYYSLLKGESAAIDLINNQLAVSPLKPSLKAAVRTLNISYGRQRFAAI